MVLGNELVLPATDGVAMTLSVAARAVAVSSVFDVIRHLRSASAVECGQKPALHG